MQPAVPRVLVLVLGQLAMAACDPGKTASGDDTGPGAPVENECESVVGVMTTYYADADGDGHGDPLTSEVACEAEEGWVTEGDDCDDSLTSVYTGAPELCDGLDNDCDGVADSPVPLDGEWGFHDADGDGFGDPEAGAPWCDEPHGSLPEGVVTNNADCDDTDASIHPGADEYCDQIDNDCDAQIDEYPVDASSWCYDWDGDGYGKPETVTSSCEDPGYPWLLDCSDCNDNTTSIHPDAPEQCGLADYDCDGLAGDDDPDADSADYDRFYADTDGDGYGDVSASVEACAAPPGYVDDRDDCDDSAATTNPGAGEIWDDGVDNDCDGTVDEQELASGAVVVSGGSATGRAGTDVAFYDRDGDGDDDLFVGEPGDGGGYVYGIDVSGTGAFDLAAADLQIDGVATDDAAGSSVANAGDVDGDGNDDLLIGAFGEDSGAADAGAAYLLYGPLSASGSLSAADAVLLGAAAGDTTGRQVRGGGDLDGDGLDDMLISAHVNDEVATDAGVAYVVGGTPTGSYGLASATARLQGVAADDRAGYALAAAGDFDGDGADDVVVGATREATGGTRAGAVYLVFGPLSGTSSLASADAVLYGTANAALGVSVSRAGDVDGDGLSDVIAGAYTADLGSGAMGAAYVLLGGQTGTLSVAITLAGETVDGEFGRSVVGGEDLDGDALSDVIVGAPEDGAATAGAVYLYAGLAAGTWTASDATEAWEGDEECDSAGYSLALGDADGDGLTDLAIGVPRGLCTTGSGAAYVVQRVGR